MTEIEGIGEAVTGDMAARAVEPTAGERLDGHTHERNCLNCGCVLVGDFCHCCGQKAHVHRTLAAWWHDFLHSVLHLDGKFWRTLPMLAFRPGELTRRYIHGERAKFISPLALFLFTVFLLFALFSLVGAGLEVNQQQIQRGIEQEIAQRDARVAQLEREKVAAAQEGRDTAAIDARIADARNEESLLRTISEQGAAEGSPFQISDDAPEWMSRPLQKAAANPELLLYKVQANAYKFSWALIPISVPFVWVLFLHRRRYRIEFTAYDHLVFVTYSIAFMSLMFIALALLRAAGVDNRPLFFAFAIAGPLHIYAQLRGTYSLSRRSAIWRTILLVNFAFVAVGLFLTLLLMLGALG